MRTAAAPLLPALALVLAAAAPASEQARLKSFDAAVVSAKSSMNGDPAKALASADRALATARSLPDSRNARIAVATAQWLDGEAHLFLNQGAAAAPPIDAAFAAVSREAPRSKLAGDLLRSKGAIAEADDRMQDALQAYQRAYAIFTAAREDRSRALTLQDIGRIYRSAGDPQRTLSYYEQSAEIFSADPHLLLTTHNGQGELEMQLRRLPQAERDFAIALAIARRSGSVMLQVRVLNNLANDQIESREIAAAKATIDRALRLSLDHEAAEWRPFTLGEAAKLAETRGDHAAAARYLDQAFARVDLASSDMEFKEFHQLASRVYDEVGKPKLALAHLRAFERLDAKARALTATYGAQLASARFDFANQNMRISALKTQKLQQEVQLERQQARMRTFVAAGALFVALGVFGFLCFALVTGRRSRDRLQGINLRLEKALEAKTEFLAMTSHEIRTPLNGILGMTQVMLSEPALGDGVRDRLRLVHGAGETMRALVDDLLDVAKMESGEVKIVEEDADLGRILDDLAALWSDQARAKGVELVCDHSGVPSALRLDPARVRQVVFNLLSNAVKFTEAGFVRVTARSVGLDPDATLEISVQDTGIGIDTAHHDLIFEPFQQADARTTRRFGGTGLGLSISRRLAHAMGGGIAVESRLGEGTCFMLTLPLKRVERARTPVAPTGSREPATSLAEAHVLLVEANQIAKGVLGRLLEPRVGKLLIAGGGDQAVALLSAQPIDHLIVEAGSAAMTGVDAIAGLRRLVALGAQRGARVTILASAAAVPIEDVAATGADQVVVKPIAGGALLARLRDLYATAPEAQAA